MKVAAIVGARPQFIKAAPVSKALAKVGIEEALINTGQHYDDNMSAAFLRELNLPEPIHHLGVGGGSHGWMTGQMLERIERVLIDEQPDCVLVYGDTNSTLAGALAAAKLKLPVAHVEAGLRSFRSTMPEEINRRLTDHVSSLLFCPTATAVENLKKEGIASEKIRTDRIDVDDVKCFASLQDTLVANVGDVMVDALYRERRRISEGSSIENLDADSYALVTVHRAESTDNLDTLNYIVDALISLSKKMPILFPVHPRTAAALENAGLNKRLEKISAISCVSPLGYKDFLTAQSKARIIVTDSGGVQKEACILGIPCLTLRDETEWVETIENGWNRLIGSRPRDLTEVALTARAPEDSLSNPFGDGQAAERIALILRNCSAGF